MQSGKSSAVVEAASAIHDKFQMYYGQSVDEETVFTAMAEAAYPIIAEAVARATADAIADKIEAMRCIYAPGDEFAQGWVEGRDHGVTVARAHGRTPETESG